MALPNEQRKALLQAFMLRDPAAAADRLLAGETVDQIVNKEAAKAVDPLITRKQQLEGELMRVSQDLAACEAERSASPPA